MEEKEKQPVTILALTSEQTNIVNAALGQYWLSLEGKQEGRHARPIIAFIQQDLVEQSKAPALDASNVVGIQCLIKMNRLTQAIKSLPNQERHNAKHEKLHDDFIAARFYLNSHNIPYYLDASTGVWRLGTYLGEISQEQ